MPSNVTHNACTLFSYTIFKELENKGSVILTQIFVCLKIVLQFCSLNYVLKFLIKFFFFHGTLLILPFLAGDIKKGCNFCPLRALLFEITSPMTSLTEGSCMMHHHTVHSELRLAMRREGPRSLSQ